MANSITRDPATGRITSKKIESDLTDDDMAKRSDTDKLTDTSALGSYKPKAILRETDPDKMSPLMRASFEAKKKRKTSVTTDDAAAALGSRR